MKLKVFTQPNCPNCPPAKEFAKKFKSKMEVEYWNITTAEGLAEAAMFNIMGTPSLVLTDDDDNELEVWRGEAPTEKEFKTKISFHISEEERWN